MDLLDIWEIDRSYITNTSYIIYILYINRYIYTRDGLFYRTLRCSCNVCVLVCVWGYVSKNSGQLDIRPLLLEITKQKNVQWQKHDWTCYHFWLKNSVVGTHKRVLLKNTKNVQSLLDNWTFLDICRLVRTNLATKCL